MGSQSLRGTDREDSVPSQQPALRRPLPHWAGPGGSLPWPRSGLASSKPSHHDGQRTSECLAPSRPLPLDAVPCWPLPPRLWALLGANEGLGARTGFTRVPLTSRPALEALERGVAEELRGSVDVSMVTGGPLLPPRTAREAAPAPHPCSGRAFSLGPRRDHALLS